LNTFDLSSCVSLDISLIKRLAKDSLVPEIGIERDDPQAVSLLHHIGPIIGAGELSGGLVDPTLELPEASNMGIVPAELIRQVSA
jgi:hypothetical protein